MQTGKNSNQNSDVALKPQARKHSRVWSRRHDPWLVLNMAMFNLESGGNEIFNQFANTRIYGTKSRQRGQ
jgi:hypothetical protein